MLKDTSWESLFKPGDREEYFTLTDPEPIQFDSETFSLINAWWMAEISHLIYHPKFYNDKAINFGCFEYELIRYIENSETSTHVAILKVLQNKPCIVIVFRGSDEIEDWGINVRIYQNDFNHYGKVHRGFKKAYLSIKDELISELEKNNLPVFITGHSLGAALAVLASSELNKNSNFDSCYTFGSPRIGNPEFVNAINAKSIYRVVNNSDVVTTIPIDFAAIIYHHIGCGFLIDENGKLHKNLDEDAIFDYQKKKLDGLKSYAISKFFNKELDTIKDDLPYFLSDHAPINYVSALANLLDND